MQQLLFPVSTVSAWNAWDHDLPFGNSIRRKKTACTLYYEFPRYASETNKIRKNIEKEVKDEKWEAD